MVPRQIVAVSWLLLLLLISSEAALLPRSLQGFGVGGTLETPPPTISPTALPYSTPTALPVSTPTALPYSTPTALPSSTPAALGNVKLDENWDVSVFSYYYELYTISTGRVLQAIAQVDEKAKESLRRLMFQQSAPVTVQRLVSQVLGACFESASEETDTPLFSNFTVCNVMKTTVYTDVDGTKLEPAILYNISLDHIRDTFVPTFNVESDALARLVYNAPISVTASLNIVMKGVQAKMNDVESQYFVDVVRAGVSAGLLNENKNESVAFEVHDVQVLQQESSSGNRLLARRKLANDTADAYFNKVEVLVTATCANAAVCTDTALQTAIDETASVDGEVLKVSLLTGNDEKELFYFDNITEVIINDDSVRIPELSPANEKQPAGEEPGKSSEGKMPQWLWIVIGVSVLIILSVLIYVCVRRSIRRLLGEQLQDHEETGRKSSSSRPLFDSPTERKNSFVLAPAPTFAEVYDLEQVHQPSHNRRSDTKEQYKGPKRSVQEMEEDDYDNRSYEDEFSVEAGDFTVADGYDEPNRHGSNSINSRHFPNPR